MTELHRENHTFIKTVFTVGIVSQNKHTFNNIFNLGVIVKIIYNLLCS